MFYSLFVKAVSPSFGARSLILACRRWYLLHFRRCVGVVFGFFHPGPTCDSQKQGNQKEKYRPHFKQPATWDSRALMPHYSWPKEKFKKFHTLILVLSKPSFNLLIVNFLCQFTIYRCWNFRKYCNPLIFCSLSCAFKISSRRIKLSMDVGGLLTDCCIDARLCLPLVVVRIRIGRWRGFSRATYTSD